MINIYEVNETNNMIEQEKLDVRTITMGISLRACADSDLDALNEKIYTKITTLAKNLVSTGKDIERDFGIPIVNKRISVTPVSYTHLDVYKRQGPDGLHRSGYLDVPCEGALSPREQR